MRNRSLSARLIRWSEDHALAMVAAVAAASAMTIPWLLSLVGAVSFVRLILECRGAWSPRGGFGVANGVTAVRLAGVLLLPAAALCGSLFVVSTALLLFALDGIDGWLARRLGQTSEFGEYFDKEVDAFFMLMLCLLLVVADRLGGWILLTGLLRYGFVLFLKWAKPPEAKERRSATGKWIYFFSVLALIAAFTPFPVWYRPFALSMTVALVYSFVDAGRVLYRPRASGG